MINVGIILASYGSFGGGTLGNLFSQWEAAGIFTYALPFLLIFSLVFGLLSKMNIFSTSKDPNKDSSKGINVMIALAVAFMSLQFNIVSMFFSEIFPRFGIALSIVLVILVLGGIFMPTNKDSNWLMVALAVIVFIIIGTVVYNSLGVFGWGVGGPSISYFWNKHGATIIFLIFIIAVVATFSSKKKDGEPRIDNLILRNLRGE